MGCDADNRCTAADYDAVFDGRVVKNLPKSPVLSRACQASGGNDNTTASTHVHHEEIPAGLINHVVVELLVAERVTGLIWGTEMLKGISDLMIEGRTESEDEMARVQAFLLQLLLHAPAVEYLGHVWWNAGATGECSLLAR